MTSEEARRVKLGDRIRLRIAHETEYKPTSASAPETYVIMHGAIGVVAGTYPSVPDGGFLVHFQGLVFETWVPIEALSVDLTPGKRGGE